MSVNEHETIADITAEMRERKSQLEDAIFNAPLCYSTDDMRAKVEILDEFIDRLEAAHGREKAAIEADALAVGGVVEAAHRRECGNSAKLREALTDAEKTLYDSSRSMYGIPPHLHALLARIRAALSAPPRNCDRFRNADEALEALERHCNSSGNGCIRCPVAGFSIEEGKCQIAWLFAHATEKEGAKK